MANGQEEVGKLGKKSSDAGFNSLAFNSSQQRMLKTSSWLSPILSGVVFQMKNAANGYGPVRG